LRRPFPSCRRAGGLRNVEPFLVVERVVRVIAAGCAAWLGSAKCHGDPPDAFGHARLWKPDRSAPHDNRESGGAGRSARRRGRRHYQGRQESPRREESFGRLPKARTRQQASVDKKTVDIVDWAGSRHTVGHPAEDVPSAPEQGEQKNDWQRHSHQPQQQASTKSHD
jgi:hypothetical protein